MNRISFEPVLVQFADTAARNPGRGTKYIGVMFAISEDPINLASTATNADIAKAANAATPFDFGQMARGTWIQAEWAEVGTSRSPFLDQRRVLHLVRADGKLVAPTLNSYAFVVESDEPSAFDQLVMTAMANNTQSLKDAAKALSSALFPQGTSTVTGADLRARWLC